MLGEDIRVPESFPKVGDVSGRAVVLTGASRGLGRVLATAFAHSGARLCLVARNAEPIGALAESLPGHHISRAGDVRDESFNEEVADAVVAEYGSLDVWISNAGISPAYGGPRRISPETWREVLEVNLTGAFLGARAAARVMSRGGRIIVTGSVLGERPARGLSAYSASKAGLVGLVKSLALDLGGSGITVNLVAPGWFDSPLAGDFRKPENEAVILKHTSLGRWGVGEDLPGAYLFLASEAAAFVTGAVIPVDGGYLLP
jgi:NAD(P)-dependent dehydrogenase (short-subunit alcohol dehydrogenase family)